jgi:hypothetical protein
VRIWDVSPGYLNRQSLLGEHRELHGLHRIHALGLTGYARHPETLRWKDALSGLALRHRLLAAEMALRGYTDRSPIAARVRRVRWPSTFIDAPARQIELLRGKYAGREPGRIGLPGSAHELWAQHKYSVMARDLEAYRVIGRRVSRLRGRAGFEEVAEELTWLLRMTPPKGRAHNAIEHMWGYVSSAAAPADRAAAARTPAAMYRLTQQLALAAPAAYLVSSTALSELAVFV